MPNKKREFQEWFSQNSHDIKLIIKMTVLGSIGGIFGGLLGSVLCLTLFQ